jgi:hypothetical protein
MKTLGGLNVEGEKNNYAFLEQGICVIELIRKIHSNLL